MGGGERVEQFIEIAVNHLLELVEREVDPVIGDAALREVVGSNALGAVARADQRLPVCSLTGLRLAHLPVLQPGGEHLHRAIAVAML